MSCLHPVYSPDYTCIDCIYLAVLFIDVGVFYTQRGDSVHISTFFFKGLFINKISFLTFFFCYIFFLKLKNGRHFELVDIANSFLISPNPFNGKIFV